jgi:hypothetical protein
VAGARIDVRHGADFNDSSQVHHGDSLADSLHNREIVSYEQE